MTSVPTLRVFAGRAALMEAAAGEIAGALRSACEKRGAACAALSGGATPEPAYALLATQDVEWPRASILLVDERCLPAGHPASNEGMLRRALAPALKAGARLLPMYVPPGSPAEAADAADLAYSKHRIDIAVMGMGADGHTASWFPGATGLSEALDPASARTVVAIQSPGAFGAADRLTLTRSALSQAERVLLLIVGAEKRRTLEHAVTRDPREAPVAALFQSDVQPLVYWAA